MTLMRASWFSRLTRIFFALPTSACDLKANEKFAQRWHHSDVRFVFEFGKIESGLS